MAFFLVLVVTTIIIMITKGLETKEKETTKEITETKQPEVTKPSSLSAEEEKILLEKIAIFDDYIISYDGLKKITEMTDTDKILFVLYLDQKAKETFSIDLTKGLSLEQVLTVLHYYFGPEMSFTPVDAPCFLNDGAPYMHYDEKEQMYHIDSDYHAHDSYYPYQVDNFLLASTKTRETKQTTYTITLHKAFRAPKASLVYASYQDALDKKNVIVDLFAVYGDKSAEEQTSLVQVQYEKNKGLFKPYTYQFETTTSVEQAYLVDLTK